MSSDPTPYPLRPKLTIITPVFNEEDNLAQYVETVRAVLFCAPEVEARVLMVDDGSTDRTWQIVTKLAAEDDRFRAVRLSRNYGAHLALAAGLDHVEDDADIIVILACDLQDPAATILDFVSAWRSGADIVWGKRRSRRDEGWRRHASSLLETTLRRFAMPRNSRFTTGSFLLINRTVLECVRSMREQNRVTFALIAWTGFNQAVVLYDRQARIAGRSGWRFGQMVNTAYDVLIGFSAAPAKVITVLGMSLCSLSILLLIYVLSAWAFTDVQPGWTGVMATITICFGVLFMMLGVTAEYLHRIFVEVKARPLYFVSAEAGAKSISRAPSA
jgi:glycosyltransferase involved in cell wall biosynthesis